jgi:hypothetical protein
MSIRPQSPAFAQGVANVVKFEFFVSGHGLSVF